jgi:catechol 2,3-dioxygenase-like lactoylglutathione lyase family enzyme
MLDHVGIQVADVPAAAAFYDKTLAVLGFARVMDFGEAIGYGPPGSPDFWIGKADRENLNHESHIAFVAESNEKVDEWFAAAKEAGAEVLHEPRLWPEYHPGYYGAFVRDPDGNNVEAVHHNMPG